MSRSVTSPQVVNIDDLRRLAKRRLPRVAFDYIDGGADGEVTLRENCRVFDDVAFRPRSAVVTQSADLRTSVLGTPIALPLLLGPVGSCRMFYPRGEAVAARAAGAAGTVYGLSTLSGMRLEEVKAASSGPCWYQVYLCGGRDVALSAIARAKAAGFSALVVTIDTPVSGLRERDFRNGIKELVSGKPVTMLPYVGQFLARPRWLAGFLADGGLMSFPNVVLRDGPMPYADVGVALEQSAVCWDDLRWLHDAWKRPDRDQGRAHGRRRAPGPGCRSERGRGVEPRRAAARRRRADAARAARGRGGGRRPRRGAAGRRHPPRRRRRQGPLPRRAAPSSSAAPTPTASGRAARPASRRRSRSCAPTSCGRSSCSGAPRSRSWTRPTSTHHRTGGRSRDAEEADEHWKGSNAGALEQAGDQAGKSSRRDQRTLRGSLQAARSVA